MKKLFFLVTILFATSLNLLLCLLLILLQAVDSKAHFKHLDRLSFSQPLAIRWFYESAETVNLTPAFNDASVYLPLAGGAVISLHVTSGQLLWRADIGGEFSAAPVADMEGVYVASVLDQSPHKTSSVQATGTLRALGITSGVTRWMRTFQFPLGGALAVNQRSVFGGSADGRVYAVNKQTGVIEWVSQYTAPFFSTPVLSGKNIYMGNEKGTLIVLDQTTGRTSWRYQTRGAIRGAVAVVGNKIFFGSSDGYVYAYDEAKGKLIWRRRTGAGVQSITFSNNGIIAASLDNFVYFFDADRGALQWKRQLPGRISSQPIQDGENVLFAPLAGDACIVLSLRNGKQMNMLPVGEGNNTAATPIVAGELLLITTRSGLVAFAPILSVRRI
ncbi:MAG: PQQ-binding-like beta-propeller repeat protein [Pyrinomonadaceae bacterium]|nr:PQQ-binding-like beta-propeller repeat protein [Pyrinomonadaceae bacterium]MDQ3254581.1 PQQ-binding-like beta-propeller repeat protein [Acidobacteriota bacterium]